MRCPRARGFDLVAAEVCRVTVQPAVVGLDGVVAGVLPAGRAERARSAARPRRALGFPPAVGISPSGC